MNNKQQEPQLNLTKDQIFKLIENFLEKGNPNEIFELTLNCLMKAERQIFLEENKGEKNKGNGYRPVQGLGMGEKLQFAVPRDRLGVFKPLILAVLKEQNEKMNELVLKLYGTGLTNSEVGSFIKDLYGKDYSSSSISRITKTFHRDIEMYLDRKLDKVYPMIMIDAIHIKVKRDTVASEAFHIVMGLKQDFTREILAVVNFPTESAMGWKEVLQSLKERGVEQVGLFVSDDLKSLDKSISTVFPESDHQKCVTHFKRNLFNKVRKKDREDLKKALDRVFNLDSPFDNIEDQVNYLKQILLQFGINYPALKRVAQRDNLALYFTYLKYDTTVRRMIYTTNWIERFNKSIRRTTKIRNSLPSPHAALMLIGYVALNAETKTYNYPITKFANDKKIHELSTR